MKRHHSGVEDHYLLFFFMSDELGMRVNDVRLKNRDVKCTSLFFKVGSKKDAMVFDWTKIIKKKKMGIIIFSLFGGITIGGPHLLIIRG